MDNSPKGHEIEWIDGDSGDIVTRGTEIYDLGQQMMGSAGLLKAIADGASGMEGLSITKIRDVVGDVYEELKLAGERYYPTGSALTAYGSTLSEVQTGLQTIIDDCEQAWATYLAAQSHFSEIDHPLPTALPGPAPAAPPPPGPSPEQVKHESAVSSARSAATSARQEFDEEAAKYDLKWDTWDEAFELAASKIGEATDGGISDHWNDNLAGFVEVALKVLAYVGMVLAVLAIVIGGPLIAVLVAVVAVLTLIGTIYQMTQKRADGTDLAWAIVGVIPFGKFAKFAEGGSEGLKAVSKGFVGIDEMGGAWGQAKSGWTAVRTSFSAGEGLGRFTQGSSGLWSGVRTTLSESVTGKNILARYMGLEDASQFADLGSDVASLRNLTAATVAAGHIGDVNVRGWVLNSVVMADLHSNDGPPVEEWQTELAATA